MESPKQFENIGGTSENKVLELVQKVGIGHMPEDTLLSLDKINESSRAEVIDTYATCIDKVDSLLGTLSSLIREINVENRSTEVFNDLLGGVSEALYKTSNQILYHSMTSPEESLVAFDELIMVVGSVNQSIICPEIINKKDYPFSSIYELMPPQNTEGYTVKSFGTLFSKDHIAFNIVSSPVYQDIEKTIKSGVRLDYGPLYKETEGEIDKTKTEWVTSIDVSGYYIDKIMNKYSPRGHHFTKMFSYKINLLMKSFSEHMEQHFDKQ